MMRLVVITFLFPLFLFCRENPFFPAEGELDMPFSSNIAAEFEPLGRATLKLPSTARVIENVTVTYKNLDGSIDTTTLELGNAVDWHLPLFISQNFESSTPETTKKEQKIEAFKELASLEFIALYATSTEIKLITEDEIVRDFLLPKPHRIVCDFKRDINIRSFSKDINGVKAIKKFRIGNHSGYYRVVIELDGYYNYKIQKQKKGYLFKLL